MTLLKLRTYNPQRIARPPIQQTPTSYAQNKKLWKMQGLPFVSRPNEGRVTLARRIYFSVAAIVMVSTALDNLGEENTEWRETLLSLQADIRNAQKQIESRRSDHFRKLPVEIFGEIARMVIQHDPNLLLPLSHVSKLQTCPIKERALKYICIQVKPRDSESSAVPPLDPGKIAFVRSKRN